MAEIDFANLDPKGSTRIRVIRSPHEPMISLNVNGEKHSFAATGEYNLPNRFLGALNDSAVEFETVPAGAEGRDGAGGGIGDARPAESLPETLAHQGIDAELVTLDQGGLDDEGKVKNESAAVTATSTAAVPTPPARPDSEAKAEALAANGDLAILDGNIQDATAKLNDLDEPRLQALLAAEKKGRKRTGMKGAINEALKARATKDA